MAQALGSQTVCGPQFLQSLPQRIVAARSASQSRESSITDLGLTDALDRLLPPLNDDASFWWRTTGKTMTNMLYQASYDPDSLIRNLLFFRSTVIPYMGYRPISAGGAPSSCRSYVCDDHSPIEYSWSWDGGKGKTQKIRFTIEPLGADSGNANDPFNQAMTEQYLGELSSLSAKTDCTIHDHFARNLLPSNTSTAVSVINSRASPNSHRSSMFVATELETAGPTVKTYLMPMLRALETSQSRTSLLASTLTSFNSSYPQHSIPAFSSLISYLSDSPLGKTTEIEMIAIDCTSPPTARVKIYPRSLATDWSTITSILTMNHTLAVSPTALASLKALWYSVLSLPPSYPETLPLPTTCTRAEAGTFYCFYARPGETQVKCKLYIPAKYYGQSDANIARGLSNYFQQRGKEREVASYWAVMEEMCQHRDLAEGCGLHSYISAEPKGDEVSVTSYFSPEINYSGRRWE